MKKITIMSLFLAFSVLMIQSCKKKEAACSNIGTAVNIGSTVGGAFNVGVSPFLKCTFDDQTYQQYYDNLNFDNTTLNFSCSSPYTHEASSWGYSTVIGAIMDVGEQSCPSLISGTPSSATYVAYVEGHGYICNYVDGHSVKFTAGKYSGGSVTVNYIWQ